MEGVDLFKERELGIDAAELVKAAQASSGLATAWVPHAEARIREGAIMKARLRDHLTWEEIASLPDVNMSVAGAQRAFYRCLNRFATAKDIPAFINNHLRRYALYREMSINRAIEKPEETNDSIRTALLADKREARLLGLDAPERVELSGRDGKPIRFESTHVIPSALIERVQQLEVEEGEFTPTASYETPVQASGEALTPPPNDDQLPTSTPPDEDFSKGNLSSLASTILPLRPAPPQEAPAREEKRSLPSGRKKFDYDNI